MQLIINKSLLLSVADATTTIAIAVGATVGVLLIIGVVVVVLLLLYKKRFDYTFCKLIEV